MAALIARPLRLSRLLRPRSTAMSSIPSSVHRRGFQMHFVPRDPPIPLQYPKLEAPIPEGVGLSKTHFYFARAQGQRQFLYSALRDACKCPKCADPHSKQRSFRTSDVPFDITPRRVDIEGGDLVVQWKNDVPGYDESHTSRYDMEKLFVPVQATTYGFGTTRYHTKWNRPYMHKNQHWISYEDYMNDNMQFGAAMRSLSDTGLIFVHGIPDSREEVANIATRMGPLRNTFYGSTWDVRKVPDATNVAYTNQFLDFHMDLMYMTDPPGYQLLHCLQNSCHGGESLFADSFRAANMVADKRPDYFEALTKTELCYEYNHDGAIYYNRWPVIETVKDGESRGTRIRRVNYSPPFQAPHYTRPVAGNFIRYKTFTDALKYFTKILESELATFELKLRPGQCVIFENRRVVHARRQFNSNSGYRWLAGAYLDEDALLSQFRRIRRDYPALWSQGATRKGQEKA